MPELNREDRKKILKERAKILARAPGIQDDGIQHVNIVEFLIDYDRYCIPMNYVREVYLIKDITKIPGTPEYVIGIINVRGQIFSVIDIKTFFNIPKRKGFSNLNKVIIIQNENMEFGIVADSIAGVKSVPLDKIVPPPLTIAESVRKYVKGITEDQLILLDADQMLTDKSIIVCEGADEKNR
ncbi:MAG: purine-binding chemotaxis protein CheW [Candidatus Kuenenia sp.]|nr:purine-binding chemotaxis protein CheW [Candidatus Kuenenia hertensis]